MQKKWLLWLFVCCVSELWGQTRVIDPVMSDYSSTATFDRIEITSERTTVDVTLRYIPKWWIRYDSLTDGLQDCNSDRRYRLIGAEGFELNKEVYMPESGEMKARFFFEPIDTDVEVVDFIDFTNPNSQKSHKTYGIHLVPTNVQTILPAWAMGNWLTTDGSNEWICGFTKNVALYQRDFWEYRVVTPKGKSALELTLRNNDLSKTLFLKKGKEGTLELSYDNKTFVTLGRELIEQHGTASEWRYDPEKYRDKLYSKQTTVIRGVLDGYTPKLGFETALLNVEDHIWNQDHQYLVEIQPDGRFTIDIEVEHPQMLQIRFGERSVCWFAEPGDTLMCYHAVSELFHPQKMWNANLKLNRYMGVAGQYSQIYPLAKAMMPPSDDLYNRMQAAIKEGETDAFKAWVAMRHQQTKDSLLALFDRYALSDRTRDFLYANFTLCATAELMSYQQQHEFSAYINNQQPDGTCRTEIDPYYTPLPRSFYNFITMEQIDNPLAFITAQASLIINRFEYAYPLSYMDYLRQSYMDLRSNEEAMAFAKQQIEAEGKELTENQKNILAVMLSGGADRRSTMVDTVFVSKFNQYKSQYFDGIMERVRYIQDNRLRITFDTIKACGLDRCLMYDYALSRDFTHRMTSEKLSDSARLVQMLPYIKTPYVIGKMVQWYTDHRPDAVPKQTSEKTRTKADEYFDQMIAPYKGNVLYIDFWGTGCGPCRSGMITARSMVKELKEHKIKFLYVACDSESPLKPYNQFLSENQIEGEHLRVTQDQWNMLKSKFNFNGIPHHEVVDKNGVVIDSGDWLHHICELVQPKLVELGKQ